jgi:hypothetical protein
MIAGKLRNCRERRLLEHGREEDGGGHFPAIGHLERLQH